MEGKILCTCINMHHVMQSFTVQVFIFVKMYAAQQTQKYLEFHRCFKKELMDSNLLRKKVYVDKWMKHLKLECSRRFDIWDDLNGFTIKCVEFYDILQYFVGENRTISANEFLREHICAERFDAVWRCYSVKPIVEIIVKAHRAAIEEAREERMGFQLKKSSRRLK